MADLGVIALDTADNGGMRTLLLTLVVLAVLLLVAGSVIAVMTLRTKRKELLSYSSIAEAES